MPYSTNSDLPDNVKSSLPERAQTVFRTVFNAQLATGKSEDIARKVAWTAVKNGWKKDGEEWVRKAEYQGRNVELDKPFRTPGESKKFAVYVKDGDSVKIVRFGDPDMEIRRDDEQARANFRSRHSCDTATDKTSARYWSCRMWSGESVSEITKVDPEYMDNQTISLVSDFSKVDDEQRIAYGWANVITKAGEPVVDAQGDIIEPDELVKATTDFMRSIERFAKEMHQGNPIGHVTHSFPLTYEIAKSLGIQTENEGWLVGVYVADDDVWEKVKKNELKAFSIGGAGQRRAIEE
jgi:cation transport regulator